ncbi:hypothetical protein C8R45DRAFT_1084001 [Mycena sanguinolenta]|nr:hypothetical protein C8R45DRAFT_1084001 [Mycena sanguinolenta]
MFEAQNQNLKVVSKSTSVDSERAEIQSKIEAEGLGNSSTLQQTLDTGGRTSQPNVQDISRAQNAEIIGEKMMAETEEITGSHRFTKFQHSLNPEPDPAVRSGPPPASEPEMGSGSGYDFSTLSPSTRRVFVFVFAQYRCVIDIRPRAPAEFDPSTHVHTVGHPEADIIAWKYLRLWYQTKRCSSSERGMHLDIILEDSVVPNRFFIEGLGVRYPQRAPPSMPRRTASPLLLLKLTLSERLQSNKITV